MSCHLEKPPKIMHVVLSLNAGGGAERLVFDMVRDPFFAGNPPVVCCLQEVGALGNQLLAENFKVFCHAKHARFDLSMVGWLASIMEEERIDVVHAHQYTPMFYAVPAAFWAGRKKVVYTEHGRLYPDIRRWKRRLINPLLSLGINHIISISEGTKRAMVEVDNFSAQKINVVHNGMNLATADPSFDPVAKRRALGLNETARVIGTAARLEEIKNLPMLLRGFQFLLEKHGDTYLLIAGRGSQESALKEYVRELGIEKRVIFLGLRDDLVEIYPLFEVFLLTSFSEGISITLLEAMSHGIPAVVSNVGGNPEVVVEGETGFLVDLNDDTGLAARVMEVLDDRVLAEKLGAKARLRAEKAFGFELMIEHYLSYYCDWRS